MVKYLLRIVGGVVGLGAVLGYCTLGGGDKPTQPKDLFPNHPLTVRADPTYRLVVDDRVAVRDRENGVYEAKVDRAELFVEAKEMVNGKEWVLHFADGAPEEDFKARAANYMLNNPGKTEFTISVDWYNALRHHRTLNRHPYPVWPEAGVANDEEIDNVIGIYAPGFVELFMDKEISSEKDIPVTIEPDSFGAVVAETTETGDFAARRRKLVGDAKRYQHEFNKGELEAIRKELKENAKKEKGFFASALQRIMDAWKD